MKVGFIGAGNIARRHAANLRYLNRVQVVAVCDLDLALAQQLAKPFHASVHRQPVEMFNKVQDLDAVLLCTPPTVRKNVIELAARRGIHVFCEKPPADSAKTGLEIVDLIEASGIICSVDFHSRYSPVLPAFFALTKDQPISSVQSTHVSGNAFSPTMQPWFFLQEKSGGHVMDQAIHTIDLLRYLIGEIEEVRTLANNLSVPVSDTFDIADTTCTLIQFANGVSATHLHSWGSRIPKIEMTFMGRELQLQLRPFTPPRLTGHRWRSGEDREDIMIEHEEGPGMGREGVEAAQPGTTPPDPPHFGSLRTFLDAIATQRPSLIKSDFRDASKTLAVVLAMNQSALTGQPVRLD